MEKKVQTVIEKLLEDPQNFGNSCHIVLRDLTKPKVDGEYPIKAEVSLSPLQGGA